MKNDEYKPERLSDSTEDDVRENIVKCRNLLQKLNFMDRGNFAEIVNVVKDLLGKSENAVINPPFYCEYGSNIEVGSDFFANYNCTIIDIEKVKIGNNCVLSPNVLIFTAGQSVYPPTRNSIYEKGKEITIGDNVWIGGNSVICPGVKIGNNVVISPGSVITGDIPDWCIATGNPCTIKKVMSKEREM